MDRRERQPLAESPVRSKAAQEVAFDHIKFLDTLDPKVHCELNHPIYTEYAREVFNKTNWSAKSARVDELLRFAGSKMPELTGKTLRPGTARFEKAFIKHYSNSLASMCSSILRNMK